ncbi:FTR1 family iron permease [Bacillus sp. EB600]|nr:FTR1 family iron permease [Bacillus sp. EB600]
MKKTKLLILLIASLVVFSLNVHPAAASESHDELFVLIGDSLMKAKDGNQAAVSKNIEQFEAKWESIKKTDSKTAKSVAKSLKAVQSLLAKEKPDNDDLSKGLSALSTAVVQYDQEQTPQDKEKQKDEVKRIYPMIDNMKNSIEKGNTSVLSAQYQSILNQWTASEKIVHDESIAAYGNIEKNMALLRIAITQDPADLGKAKQSLEDLTVVLDNFFSGKASKQHKGSYKLEDLSKLLSKAKNLISQNEYASASKQLNEVLTIWPMVEGEVQTRDPKLYSDLETKVPAAISILNSQKVEEKKAEDIVKDLNSRLIPLTSKTNYTFWDAALILLREGFEALLILATLLSFLKRIGEERKQKWIWMGVAAGITASAVLSLVINIAFSKIIAASSREYIEGITGVIAVAMMVTVGVWLHNKSSVNNWNNYIHQQMSQAIAKGSLMSFALISFLSIFREGAETIIFYAGIAPNISLQQLLLGIVLAILLLVAAGFVIIYYSVKIPVRLFFKVATIFIYLIAFKILGISIHALQVGKVLSIHTADYFPFIDWIGVYPTWETSLTQVLLLIFIFSMVVINRKKDRTQVEKMNSFKKRA